MNSTPSHVAGLAYEVRTNSGRLTARYRSANEAEQEAHAWQDAGSRAYVTFVELIDGAWTAPED